MATTSGALTINNHNPSSRSRTAALVRHIKADNSDFEWYPTTDAMLQVIKADLLKAYGSTDFETKEQCIGETILDCGAGDGRALMFLTQGTRYAIEKSRPLVEAMDKDILVIGSDFYENTLLDKKVTAIFCNPPYSDYATWTCKIIKEAQAAVAYLIIPQRWTDCDAIKQALALRDFKTEVLDSFDFSTADRSARAKVDIVKIKMTYDGYGLKKSKNDAFDVWFSEHFKIEASKNSVSDWERKQKAKEAIEKEMASKGELVKREGLVRILDGLYQRDLSKLMGTYESMTRIDHDLLRELDININSVKASLALKIKGLKDIYWNKLFDSLDQITDKLCTSTRKEMLSKLTANTHIDFNEGNCVNIIIWILKQANTYFDEQIISTYEKLTEHANIVKYKSNQRTVQFDRWRYAQTRYSTIGPYGLDYRIVIEGMSGYIESDGYSNKNNLADSATALINDLVTIANNLGFDATGNINALQQRFSPGKNTYYWFFDAAKGEKQVLFEVKAFKKGTLHFRLHERFIQKLNVVHGRLKGWLRSAQEAAEELDIPMDVAQEAYTLQLELTINQLPLLSAA